MQSLLPLPLPCCHARIPCNALHATSLPSTPCPQFAELRDRLAQVQSAGVLVSLCDKLRAEMQRQDIRCAWAGLQRAPRIAAGGSGRWAQTPPPLPAPPRSYHDLSGRPKHLWGVFKKMTSKK